MASFNMSGKVNRPSLVYASDRRLDYRYIRDTDGNETWLQSQPEYDCGEEIKAGSLVSLHADGKVYNTVAADFEYDASSNFVGVALEYGTVKYSIHIQTKGRFAWETKYVGYNGTKQEEFFSSLLSGKYAVGQQTYLEYDVLGTSSIENVTTGNAETHTDYTVGTDSTITHDYANISLSTEQKKYFQYTRKYTFGIVRELTTDRIVVELNVSEQKFDDQVVMHTITLGEDVTINATRDPVVIALKSHAVVNAKGEFDNTKFTATFQGDSSTTADSCIGDDKFILIQQNEKAWIINLSSKDATYGFGENDSYLTSSTSQYDVAHLSNLKNQGITPTIYKYSDIGTDLTFQKLLTSFFSSKDNGMAASWDGTILTVADNDGHTIKDYAPVSTAIYFSSAFYEAGNEITKTQEGGLAYTNLGFKADFRRSNDDVFGVYFPRHSDAAGDVKKRGTTIPVTVSGKVLWNNTTDARACSWKNIDLDTTAVDLTQELFSGLDGQMINKPDNYWNGYIWYVGRALEDYFEVRIQRRTLNTLISSIGSILPCDVDNDGNPIVANGYLLCDGTTKYTITEYEDLYDFLVKRFDGVTVTDTDGKSTGYFIIPKFGFANGYGQILAKKIAGFLNVEKNYFIKHDFTFSKPSIKETFDITSLMYKGVLLDEMESTPMLTSLDVEIFFKDTSGVLKTVPTQTYFNTGNSVGCSYKVEMTGGRYFMTIEGKLYYPYQGAPKLMSEGELVVYVFQKKYAGVEYVDLLNHMPAYLSGITSFASLKSQYAKLDGELLDAKTLYNIFTEITDTVSQNTSDISTLKSDVTTLKASGSSSVAYKRILAELLPLDGVKDGAKNTIEYPTSVSGTDAYGTDEFTSADKSKVTYALNKTSTLKSRLFTTQAETHGTYAPTASAVSVVSVALSTGETKYFETKAEADDWIAKHFDSASVFGNDKDRT